MSARDDALSVLRHLRQAGFEAYFAGGCVRDLSMHQEPKDYDVATNAPPEKVRGLFKNTQAVGAAFGVILVRQGKTTIEVATFRTDLEYRDGRRPSGVQFASAEEDAKRRDFTINGLFLDPVENRIIDFVGGQADLTQKRLRAIGDADHRFAEDHLRLLRAVRFASRFGFEIESSTAKAIGDHAQQLIRISPERIAEELRKMLMPTTRNLAFELLKQFGLIDILMRFFPEKSNGRSIELFESLHLEEPIPFGLALAGIVLDFRMNATKNLDPRAWIAPHEVKRTAHLMRQTLKISNEESAELTGAMAFIQLLADPYPTVAILKRFLNQPHAGDAMLMMCAMMSCGLMTQRIEAVLGQLSELGKTQFAPLPLVSGDDLTAAGALPGPKFKLALDAAYDAQLEGRIATRDEALRLALTLF